MGSWNKTCGLSNLHIYSGTPVYVFVMEQNKDRYDRCYTTALYKPCLLAFKSVYNDYGGGENSSGPGLPFIMAALKEHLHEMPLGKNKYHDIAVTKAAFDEELFFRAVHEGRLKLDLHCSEPVDVEFVMFRQDVVDQILRTYVAERYVGAGQGTGGWNNAYVHYSWADVATDVHALVDAIAEKVNEPVDSRFAGMPAQWRPGVSLYQISDRRGSNKAAWYVPVDAHQYASFLQVDRLVIDLVEAKDSSTAVAVLTEYLRGAFLDEFMMATRRIWVPGCHEGSQGAGYKEYLVLADTVRDCLRREIEENEEENDDTVDLSE